MRCPEQGLGVTLGRDGDPIRGSRSGDESSAGKQGARLAGGRDKTAPNAGGRRKRAPKHPGRRSDGSGLTQREQSSKFPRQFCEIRRQLGATLSGLGGTWQGATVRCHGGPHGCQRAHPDNDSHPPHHDQVSRGELRRTTRNRRRQAGLIVSRRLASFEAVRSALVCCGNRSTGSHVDRVIPPFG